MITKHQMFEPLLQACPSFVPKWREFLQDAEGTPTDDLLYYVLLGDLALHLIELYTARSTDEFSAVFEVVERWHTEGDHYVREAATIGLLEGIQNVASHREFDTRIVETWMQPETKKWWDKLNRYWGGDVNALHDD